MQNSAGIWYSTLVLICILLMLGCNLSFPQNQGGYIMQSPPASNSSDAGTDVEAQEDSGNDALPADPDAETPDAGLDPIPTDPDTGTVVETPDAGIDATPADTNASANAETQTVPPPAGTQATPVPDVPLEITSLQVDMPRLSNGIQIWNIRDFYITFNRPAYDVSVTIFEAEQTIPLAVARPYDPSAVRTTYALGVSNFQDFVWYDYEVTGTDFANGTVAVSRGRFLVEWVPY